MCARWFWDPGDGSGGLGDSSGDPGVIRGPGAGFGGPEGDSGDPGDASGSRWSHRATPTRSKGLYRAVPRAL